MAIDFDYYYHSRKPDARKSRTVIRRSLALVSAEEPWCDDAMSGWYYTKIVNGITETLSPYDEHVMANMLRDDLLPPDTLLYHAKHAPN